MNAVLVIVGAVLILAIDLPPLKKKGFAKERWVLYITLTVSTLITLAYALDYPLPNPADWIKAIYEPVFKLYDRWLRV